MSKARIYGYQAQSSPRSNVDARYREKMRQKQNIAAQAAPGRHKEKGGTS